MPKFKQPVGILGGTFDPIHNGHLKIARRVLIHCHLMAIRFIPNRIPPHREQPIANSQHRLKMLQLALVQEPSFLVDEFELQQDQPSYMINTLKHLRKLHPQQPQCLILGSDAFNHFNKWHQWQDILNYCHLIIINRPETPLNNAKWSQDLFDQHLVKDVKKFEEYLNGKIYLQKINPIEISATLIRNKLAKGEDVTGLLPEAIISYIKKNNLYIE